MKKYTVILALLILFGVFVTQKDWIFRMDKVPLGPNNKNLAEELGYAADAKLLVVNSDDSCAHPSFTEGLFKAMESGLVKSTSVIVHDRNDDDLIRMAEAAKQHPELGVGIHLALTNEYQHNHPWKPVLSKDIVPTLYNDQGLSWASIAEVEKNVNPEHAAMEFEAQIQKALRLGIQLTHIDSHMGTIYSDSYFPGAPKNGLRLAAIKVAEKYQLPLTMNMFDKKLQPDLEYLDRHHILRPDTFFGFYELEDINRHLSYEGSFIQQGLTRGFVKALFGLTLPYHNTENLEEDIEVRMEINKQAIMNLIEPGLNHFYMHVAVPVAENGLAIPDGLNHKPGLDKVVRLGDMAVWTSEEMKQFLVEEDVKLINYTDIREIQRRRQSLFQTKK